MAVLRSIKFVVSGNSEYNLHFTVPPVFEVETYYDKSYHGYITGVTGTEFLPQTMITTPKAFGGTHFHGFNVLDREVVVTFHPLSKLRPVILEIGLTELVPRPNSQVDLGKFGSSYPLFTIVRPIRFG